MSWLLSDGEQLEVSLYSGRERNDSSKNGVIGVFLGTGVITRVPGTAMSEWLRNINL